jgi:hypothetical protein
MLSIMSHFILNSFKDGVLMIGSFLFKQPHYDVNLLQKVKVYEKSPTSGSLF